jgi:hypothetical protein
MKSKNMEDNTDKIKEVIAEVIQEADKQNLTTERIESSEVTEGAEAAEMYEEGIVEFTSAGEYINSAYFALSAVDDIDTAIISKEDEKRIKRIKRKSIKIIDVCICEMYDELFDSDDDD